METTSHDELVTLVITSCGRVNLLKKTIESFDTHNTYPITKRIIIEDSGDVNVYNQLQELYGDTYSIIFNEPKLGQIKSIDRAYQEIETDWIFHCEDDWEFYREGFIENSFSVLIPNPEIIQVWLRAHDDTNKHPILPPKLSTVENVDYFLLDNNYTDGVGENWGGFGFNPGLRRMSDYITLGSNYDKVGHEKEVSQWYASRGFSAAILNKPAVRHIGWGKHVLDTTVFSNSLKSKFTNRVNNMKTHFKKLIKKIT